MSQSALYIPVGGASVEAVACGYVDALRALGWDVICREIKTKLEVIESIERYGVRLIFTTAKYGTRQLPVDAINANGVAVVARTLLFNAKNETFGGTSECLDPSDPYILGSIERCLICTNLEYEMWDRYLHRWIEMDMCPMHLPAAGNIVRALPGDLNPVKDLAIVANFAHRMDVMRDWVVPLLRRLSGRCSAEIHGDAAWNHMGLGHVRPLRATGSRLAEIYGRARVCPNFHASEQRSLAAVVNGRTFTIPLCGGRQIVDTLLARRYLGEAVDIASNPTEMIALVEDAIRNPADRFARARKAIEAVALNHTYFNRLSQIFGALHMDEQVREAQRTGLRFAMRHIWEMDRRIEAAARGEMYAPETVV